MSRTLGLTKVNGLYLGFEGISKVCGILREDIRGRKGRFCK